MIVADAFFNSRSEQLGALTLRHALPTIFQYPEFVDAGGLMSYSGSNATRPLGRQLFGPHSQGREASRPASPTVHQGRADHQPKTARALGLNVPPTLLARADEVIE